MAHECIFCGESCDCDGEDHDQPAPVDCSHWISCEAVVDADLEDIVEDDAGDE